MSTSGVPQRPPRPERPDRSFFSQAGNNIREKVPEDFLNQMEKVLGAQKENLGSGGSVTEQNFTKTPRPGPTTASQSEEKKHTLKKRFLNAILKGDFKQAFREISHKVSQKDFVNWLQRVLPDANVSFRTFEGIHSGSIDGLENGADTKLSVAATHSENIGKVERTGDKELSVKHLEEGTKIFGQIDELFLREQLYKAKYDVVKQIDNLLVDLESVGEPADRYRAALTEMKVELLNREPDPAVIKAIAVKNRDVIETVYPIFTATAGLDPAKFKENFKVLVEGYCGAIERCIDEEGLFRVVGRVPTQAQISSQFLDGFTVDEVFEDIPDVKHYCSALKVLFIQVKQFKDQGVLSPDDIRDIRGSLERVNEMLKSIEANENNKMTKENIQISAPELLRVLNPAGYYDFAPREFF